MAKNARLVPYPKRLKTLIKDYQINKSKEGYCEDKEAQVKNSRNFHKVLELIDRLVIKIIKDIYKFETYSFLKNYEPNEIYHTAIVALEKVISKIEVDDNFSIKKLSSYLNGYIGREFKTTFRNKFSCINIEDIEINYSKDNNSSEFDFPHHSVQEHDFSYLDLEVPGFPKTAVNILRKTIVDKMSLQEIADEMGVKKGYVRYWANRGKNILRRVIERERKK